MLRSDEMVGQATPGPSDSGYLGYERKTEVVREMRRDHCR